MQNTQSIFPPSMIREFDMQEIQRDGVIEAIKEIVKEKTKNAQKLNAMLTKAKTVPLFRLSTFFPLKFFPVHIIIETDKIVVTFQEFMRSGQIISLTTDILQEVAVESGPLFSTLRLTTNKPMEPIISIKYLKKGDALKARRIIQGLITAQKNDVELENIRSEELVEKLEGIGKSREAESIVA